MWEMIWISLPKDGIAYEVKISSNFMYFTAHRGCACKILVDSGKIRHRVGNWLRYVISIVSMLMLCGGI